MTGALHVLQLQLSPLTISIILSCNKIENGDTLVPACRGCHGNWPLNDCCRRCFVVVVLVLVVVVVLVLVVVSCDICVPAHVVTV